MSLVLSSQNNRNQKWPLSKLSTKTEKHTYFKCPQWPFCLESKLSIYNSSIGSSVLTTGPRGKSLINHFLSLIGSSSFVSNILFILAPFPYKLLKALPSEEEGKSNKAKTKKPKLSSNPYWLFLLSSSGTLLRPAPFYVRTAARLAGSQPRPEPWTRQWKPGILTTRPRETPKPTPLVLFLSLYTAPWAN